MKQRSRMSVSAFRRKRRCCLREFGCGKPLIGPVAQRELAWVVHYHDNEEYFDAPTNSILNENYGAQQTMRIACPEVTDTALLQPDSDIADAYRGAMGCIHRRFSRGLRCRTAAATS